MNISKKIIFYKEVCILLFIILIHTSVFGQIKLFSGFVLDSASHRSLPFATITNLNTNQFVLADSAGKFSIAKSNGDSIMLSHVGFSTQVKTIVNHDQIFYLSKEFEILTEISVFSKSVKSKEINLGYNNTKFNTELSLQKDYRSAVFIKNEDMLSGFIKSVVFKLKNKGECNEGIKVLIFLPDTNNIKKSNLLLGEPIYIYHKKIRKVNVINIENLKIPFGQEGIIISLETFGGNENCDPKKTIMLKATTQILNDYSLIGYGKNKWGTYNFPKHGYTFTPQIGIILLTK